MMDPLGDGPTFAVPHAFDDHFGKRYAVPERYFYVILRKLVDRRKSESGWTLLFDAPGPTAAGNSESFATYGLSKRTCKSARRKLREDGLVECRWKHGRKGQRIGTEYWLLDARMEQSPKAVHQAIIGRVGGELDDVSTAPREILRAFTGIPGPGDISLDKLTVPRLD